MKDEITYPSWWIPEEGAAPVLYKAEAEVPKGWIHFPGSYNFQTGQWIDAPKTAPEPPESEETASGGVEVAETSIPPAFAKFDRDGDGKPGGSKKGRRRRKRK